MKTVEVLAKYLPEWPLRYARIVQKGDCIFFGVLAGNELAFEAIPGERLAGLMLTEDHGTSVTCEEWSAARDKAVETFLHPQVLGEINIKAGSIKADDLDHALVSEARYQAKLHYLGECLVTIAHQQQCLSKSTAETIADAVSSAFDRIKA